MELVSFWSNSFSHAFELEIDMHPEIAANHEYSHSDRSFTEPTPSLFLSFDEIPQLRMDLQQKLVIGGISENPLIRDRVMRLPHIEHRYGNDGDCSYFLKLESNDFLSHIQNDLEWPEQYCKEWLLFILHKKSWAQKIFVCEYLENSRDAVQNHLAHRILLPRSKDYANAFTKQIYS